MNISNYRLRCEYGVAEAIGTVIIWIIISIVTLGLGLFLLPYYLLKGPINKTKLLDNSGNIVGQLSVEVNLAEIIGHALIWFVITIVTLGLAYFVYFPAVVKRLLNGVEIR